MYRTRPLSTADFICFSLSESFELPVFTSMKSTSLISSPFAAPGNATKSIGLPTNRTSAGLHGKFGRNGAICSPISPAVTAFDFFTDSSCNLRISSRISSLVETEPNLYEMKIKRRTIIRVKRMKKNGFDIKAASVSRKLFMLTFRL